MLPRDSHVTDPGEIRRLTGFNARVLARLEQGPATANELAQITLKYTQRISDLRAAGYTIRCAEAPGGLSTYYLRPSDQYDANAVPAGRLI